MEFGGKYFSYLYIAMTIMSFVIYFINIYAKRNIEKSIKIVTISTYIYCIFVICWAFLMTYADHLEGFKPSTALLFVCIMFICGVFYLNPIIIIPLLFVIIISYILCLRFVFNDTSKNIYMPNLYIFISTGIILSLARYRVFIREIKQSSLIKKAKQEADSANKAKSSFLAVMSHEIRTPMNAIIGLTDMALLENPSEQTKEYLRLVKNSGQSLLAIINDILDFSKIESGRLTIVPVEYDIIAMLADTSSLVEVRIGNKSLILSLKINPNIPCMLCGDDIRIKQIVLNLAANAVKFTEKGSVTISVDFEKDLVDNNKILLKIDVVDTGIGIKQEDLGKLFNSFSQVDMSHNRKKEGTGLGLAISKQLVDLMGGQIGVESEYGKGSRFHISIPQTVVKQNTVKKIYSLNDESSFADGFVKLSSHDLLHDEKFTSRFNVSENISLTPFIAPDARLLVVDDNPINLQVAVGLMKPYQLKVDTASDGREAYEKTKQNHYDVIFLDHMMPELDGFQTAALIKTIKRYNDGTPFKMPVLVAFTANVMEDVREKFIEEGFVDFIPKPIDTKELDIKLRHLIPSGLQIAVGKLNSNFAKQKDDSPTEQQIGSSKQKSEEFDFSFLQRLGFDTEAAILNTGNYDNYLNVLKSFVAVASANEKKITAFFEEAKANNFTVETLKNYTISVHSLKSSARIIGIKQLSSIAEKLESCGYRGDSDTIKSETPVLLEKYTEAVKNTSDFLAEIDRTAMAKSTAQQKISLREISDAEYNEKLKEIETASNDCDENSVTKVLKNLTKCKLDATQSELIKKVSIALDDFDFETCKSLVQK